MEITYVVVISVVTYILGLVNKTFINKIPNKLIPYQNVAIGIISGILCYSIGLYSDIVTSIIICLASSMAAGGIADLRYIKSKGGDTMATIDERENLEMDGAVEGEEEKVEGGE